MSELTSTLDNSSELPILDTSRIETILGNDESLILNVMMEFNVALLEDLESIEKELNRNFDFTDLRNQAHKIKGGSLNLGAAALAELSDQLELASLNRSMKRIEELKEPFSRTAKATLDEIKRRLDA